MKSIKDADISGRRIVLRASLNEPLRDGAVANDARLKALVPTLEYLHSHGAVQITIIGYVGRPGGKVVESLRVAPVKAALGRLTTVPFEMLENLRFDPREEANDPTLAQELALHGDIFVNDAFADAHRPYASIVGVPKLLPSYAGLLMEREVAGLMPALTPPPGAIAIIGGAKFETKLHLIQKLLSQYSEVLLGGALGNDIIKARGLPFGASVVSHEPVPVEVASNERLVAPIDAVVMSAPGAERETIIADIRAEERIIDIGPATSKLWAEKVAVAPFVLWNGPMGIYEEGYVDGTDVLAMALCQSPVHAVVGGGDTVAALQKHEFDTQKVFTSTGGGAMLDFLTHGTLPGLEALRD